MARSILESGLAVKGIGAHRVGWVFRGVLTVE
jgi:hypothetical protein